MSCFELTLCEISWSELTLSEIEVNIKTLIKLCEINWSESALNEIKINIKTSRSVALSQFWARLKLILKFRDQLLWVNFERN